KSHSLGTMQDHACAASRETESLSPRKRKIPWKSRAQFEFAQRVTLAISNDAHYPCRWSRAAPITLVYLI
ncbi:hypothetical protein P3388_25995, partial [Vibrio parahaemolyticus]|nr:hypothetical protein [Vibrio parahaemolyticus]